MALELPKLCEISFQSYVKLGFLSNIVIGNVLIQKSIKLRFILMKQNIKNSFVSFVYLINIYR